MIDHIPHLEELIYEHGKEGLEEVIKIVSNAYNDSLEISLKYDGAPSIFFGVTGKGRKPFIATKSLLNKKPIFFTNATDILKHYSDKNPELGKKLIGVFCNITSLISTSIRANVWQGDLLYWPGLIENEMFGYYKTFRPNVIKYKTKYNNLVNEYGIAVHSRYAYGENRHDISDEENFKNMIHLDYINNSMMYMYINNMDFWGTVGRVKVKSDLQKVGLDLILSESERLLNMKGSDEFFSTLQIHSKELKQRYNRYIRTGQILNLPDSVFSKKLEAFELGLVDALKEFKNMLISDFEKGSLTTYVNYHDNPNKNIPVKHEGFVVDTKFGKAKIVDRHEFSAINFSDKYIRGWQK